MYSSGQIVVLADLDSFFVSVERLHQPELIGLPVVVGGPPESRGVIAACSYEARALGMHSAMPMGQAYAIAQAAQRALEGQRGAVRIHQRDHKVLELDSAQLAATSEPFADLIRERAVAIGSIIGPVVFLHGQWLHGGYTLHSRRVQDILRESVPDISVRSIDEFELDLSGCGNWLTAQHGGVLAFAEALRARVKSDTGLSLSMGLGPNRLIAKMASKLAKPHKALPGAPIVSGGRASGIYVVQPQDALAFLQPLPVQEVPGIGPATTAALERTGIYTVGELLAKPVNLLIRLHGKGLAGLAAALTDYTPSDDGAGREALKKHGRPKSIGHQSTFGRDQDEAGVFEAKLWQLMESACRRLRAAGLAARHLTVTVRYKDFSTLTHGGYLSEPADNERRIFPQLMALFRAAHTRPAQIRLLGVRLEELIPGGSQPLLFDAQESVREQRFFGALDLLRERYGEETLAFGVGVRSLREQLGKPGLAAGGQPSSFTEGSPLTQRLAASEREQREALSRRGIAPGSKAAEKALGKYPSS